ncbi:uncharacterized protein K441DRAFT_329774 [Cenococcum geophilum 1.58]|uniref:Uncharacterized protein n=1 Tax=Cenococcum geophilum 1.58 TaxID=794803 RepID=A0ACC8EPR3_9PEZI|nr:hypothetical protein K441DRAFT_329774 [Cenococcum geophilum 1.58]
MNPKNNCQHTLERSIAILSQYMSAAFPVNPIPLNAGRLPRKDKPKPTCTNCQFILAQAALSHLGHRCGKEFAAEDGSNAICLSRERSREILLALSYASCLECTCRCVPHARSHLSHRSKY